VIPIKKITKKIIQTPITIKMRVGKLYQIQIETLTENKMKVIQNGQRAKTIDINKTTKDLISKTIQNLTKREKKVKNGQREIS